MAMVNWDVTAIAVKDDNTVWVRFADGLEGIVQFLPSACRGVFSCLQDPEVFRLARIEDGVLTWPGELDLAPDAGEVGAGLRPGWGKNARQ